MISSPCKKCFKVDQPKNECIEDCDLIQNIQNITAGERNFVCVAGDYSDNMQFGIQLVPKILQPIL